APRRPGRLRRGAGLAGGRGRDVLVLFGWGPPSDRPVCAGRCRGGSQDMTDSDQPQANPPEDAVAPSDPTVAAGPGEDDESTSTGGPDAATEAGAADVQA